MYWVRGLARLIPRRYWRTERLQRALIARAGWTVQSGPFAGMKYVDQSAGSTHIPKILGTYERELHGIIEHIVSISPARVLNVGAGEGYYGVGLACRLPETRVESWEMSDRGQLLMTKLVEANGIELDRVCINGFCSITSIRHALVNSKTAGPILIVMDVEGGESLLLEPEILPELSTCVLLVEAHEFAVQGVVRMLKDRFARTHRIESIEPKARSIEDWPHEFQDLLSSRNENAALALMNEGRPPGITWLFMQPREM